MARLVRTSHAEQDLIEIGSFIADDSPSAALRVLDTIEIHLQAIAGSPNMGEACPHLGPDLRQSSVGNYVVFHRPVGEDVIIVRVIHGARDVPRVIDQD